MDDIKVTDIKHGLGEFVPKPDKPASFAALKETLKKAGYALASADITVSGALVRDGDRWAIEVNPSKQRFALAGADVDRLLQGVDAGSSIEVTGGWQTISKDAASREIIQLGSAKKLAAIRNRPGSIAAVTKQATATLEDIEGSLGGAGRARGLSLSSIRTTNTGLAFHSDLSYSQAHRRIIYGGNIETTVRGERDGYRLGHEVRVNTDLEYVLLPLKYQSPGHELFVSLETSYNYRHRGRLGG